MAMADAQRNFLPLELVRNLSQVVDDTASYSSSFQDDGKTNNGLANDIVVANAANAEENFQTKMDHYYKSEDHTTTTTNVNHYYQMVAFDLDGTLLRSNRTISDATVKYIQDMSRRGILIAVCTGRSAHSALPHLKRLNLSKPIPVVCINGAKGMMIEPFQQDQDYNETTTTISTTTKPVMTTLFRNPLSESTTQTIKRVAKSLGHVAVWYYDEAAYAYAYNDAHVRLVKLFERLTKSKISIVRESNNYKDNNNDDETTKNAAVSAVDHHQPSRIVVLFLEGKPSEVAAAFESEFVDGEAYVVPGSKSLYVEILGADVHKGRGLQELCHSQNINIPLSQCVAIGDGDNDTEFLDVAGFGICMKNGSPGSKAVANVVTQFTNDEDGVWKSLQQLEESGILQFDVPPCTARS